MPITVAVATTFKGPANAHIPPNVVAGFNDIPGVQSKLFPTEELIEGLESFCPDIFLLLGGSVREDIQFSGLAAHCKHLGVVTAYWQTDDPYEFDARYRFFDWFDLIFTNDLGSIPYYFNDDRVFHLPLAASMISDFREIPPQRTPNIPLFFAGFPYPNRREIVSDIVKFVGKHSIVVAGTGWDDLGVNVHKQWLSHAELISCYAQCKFALNMGRHYNIANQYFNLTPTTPNPRTFELALAGAPQIFVADIEEIHDYYKDRHEIFVIQDVREIHDILHFAEDEPEALRNIAINAQRRTKSEHLYSHRAKRILDCLSDRSLIAPLSSTRAGHSDRLTQQNPSLPQT